MMIMTDTSINYNININNINSNDDDDGDDINDENEIYNNVFSVFFCMISNS